MNAGDSLACSEANRLRQARVNGAGVRPKPVVDPAQKAGHFCHDPPGLALPVVHLSRVVKTIGNIDWVVGSHIQAIQIVVKTDLRSAGEQFLLVTATHFEALVMLQRRFVVRHDDSTE